MNISEMHTIFDLICDKKGSDYFSDNEKDAFINLAIDSIANDYFYNIKKKAQANGVPQYSFEMSQLVSEVFWPIIEVISMMTDTNGYIDKADIETLVTKPILHILCVATPNMDLDCSQTIDDYAVCRYVRHNDFTRIGRNSFKKPEEEFPIFRYIADKIKINPSGIRPVAITVLRKPERVSLSGSVDCELPDFLSNEILMRSLSYAGISIRERDLLGATEQMRQQNG